MSTLAKIRIGIIGLGFGQSVHLPAFRQDSRCVVQAVSSFDFEKAKVVAKAHGIPKAHASWQALIEDPEIDLVSIAVPPHLQGRMAKAVLQNGKALFCEKPLATSLPEAQEIYGIWQKSSVAAAVDFEFPSLDTWKKAHSILASGKLGPVRQISLQWSMEHNAVRKNLDTWKLRSQEGGGALFTFMSHSFHYLEWLAGPLQEISAQIMANDRLLNLAMTSRSGIPVTANISTQAPFGVGHRLEISCQDGALILHNSGSDYISGFQLFEGNRQSENLVLLAREIESLRQFASGKFTDGRIMAVSKLVSGLLDKFAGLASKVPDLKEGLRVQELLTLARQSSDEKRSLLIPLF